MDQKTHDDQHDSRTEPQPDCDWCQREILRRTFKCHGDGAGGIKLPPKKAD
jgi:hypothetical protein